jgi:hypothetical protein
MNFLWTVKIKFPREYCWFVIQIRIFKIIWDIIKIILISALTILDEIILRGIWIVSYKCLQYLVLSIHKCSWINSVHEIWLFEKWFLIVFVKVHLKLVNLWIDSQVRHKLFIFFIWTALLKFAVTSCYIECKEGKFSYKVRVIAREYDLFCRINIRT